MARLSTQRQIVRTLLSLPAPILRLMSGGGVVYKGGRTLDPRLQFITAGSRRSPAMNTLTPEAARDASARGLAALSGDLDPSVRVETLRVPTPAGGCAARVYRPARQDPAMPVLVYAHMGGGVIGDLDTCEAFCGLLAKTLRGPVLSVDYRLAPEHRFPAGLDDMLAAFRWARDNAADLGAPAGQAAIGGDSMGGHFAAIIAQDLQQAGEPQPALQLLVYPCVDVASETPSMTTYGDAFPLSRPIMDWFMSLYMTPSDDPIQRRLSPLGAESLEGLAPAIVVTAGFDPLVDQGLAYAERLRQAGVAVTYRCYDSLSHGFTAFTGAIPAADRACREIAALARDVLKGEGV